MIHLKHERNERKIVQQTFAPDIGFEQSILRANSIFFQLKCNFLLKMCQTGFLLVFDGEMYFIDSES